MQERMSIFILSQTHHSSVVPVRTMCMYGPAELTTAGLGCLSSPRPQILILPKLPPKQPSFSTGLCYTGLLIILWFPITFIGREDRCRSFPLELCEKSKVYSWGYSQSRNSHIWPQFSLDLSNKDRGSLAFTLMLNFAAYLITENNCKGICHQGYLPGLFHAEDEPQVLNFNSRVLKVICN